MGAKLLYKRTRDLIVRRSIASHIYLSRYLCVTSRENQSSHFTLIEPVQQASSNTETVRSKRRQKPKCGDLAPSKSKVYTYSLVFLNSYDITERLAVIGSRVDVKICVFRSPIGINQIGWFLCGCISDDCIQKSFTNVNEALLLDDETVTMSGKFK